MRVDSLQRNQLPIGHRQKVQLVVGKRSRRAATLRGGYDDLGGGALL